MGNGESLEPMNDEGGNGESLEPMNDKGNNGESLEPMNDEGDNGGNLETDNNNDSTVDTNRVCRAENSMTEDVCNSSNNKTIPDYPYNLQGDPPSSRNSPRNFNHPTTPNRTNTSTDTGTPVYPYRESNQNLPYTPNGNNNSEDNMRLEGGNQSSGNKRPASETDSSNVDDERETKRQKVDIKKKCAELEELVERLKTENERMKKEHEAALQNKEEKANEMIQELRQEKEAMKEEHDKAWQNKEQEVMKMLANTLKDDGETITRNKYIGQLNMLNQPHGKGVMTLDNGDKYDGDWENGKREGRGIFTLANGNKYDGEIKNNKREGYGILHGLMVTITLANGRMVKEKVMVFYTT